MEKQNQTKNISRIEINFFQPANPSLYFWSAWIFIFFLYVLLRINIVHIPLDRDEGLFGYAGQIILHGGIPYKDVLDIKPPIIFYLNALALLFFQPTSAGMHFFLHSYNFFTLIVLFFIGKKIGSSNQAGIWVAFAFSIVSSLSSIQGFTGSTEMFLLLPFTFSLLITMVDIEKNKWYYPFMGGIFGAIAFWIKATAIFLVAFIGIYYFFNLFFTNRRSNFLLSLVIWNSGFLLITGLIFGYFYKEGVFKEFLYWSFTQSYYYAQQGNMAANLSAIFSRLKIISHVVLPFSIFGLFGLCYYLIKRPTKGLFLLGFLIFSGMAIIPGFHYYHYYAQLAPAISITCGMGICIFISFFKKKLIKVFCIIFFIGVSIAIPVCSDSAYYFKSPISFSSNFFYGNPFPESKEVANYIAKRTEKNDRIFIFGSEPEIFYYAQRQSSTAFAVIYPLMGSAYPRQQEFEKRLWEEVTINKPKYIITTNIRMSFCYDRKADKWIDKKLEKLILILKDYSMEAVVPVSLPPEERSDSLVLLSNGKQTFFDKTKYKLWIAIFRAKDS